MESLLLISLTYLYIWWDFRKFNRSLNADETDANRMMVRSVDRTVENITEINHLHNTNIWAINEITTKQNEIIKKDTELLEKYTNITDDITSIKIDLKKHEKSLYEEYGLTEDVLQYLTGQIRMSETILKETNEILSSGSKKINGVINEILDIQRTIDNATFTEEIYTKISNTYWDVDLTKAINWNNDLISDNIDLYVRIKDHQQSVNNNEKPKIEHYYEICNTISNSWDLNWETFSSTNCIGINGWDENDVQKYWDDIILNNFLVHLSEIPFYL